jgi:hypothetical protein
VSSQHQVHEKTHQTGGLGLKERKRWNNGENFIMTSINIFTVQQVLHRVSIGKRMRWVEHVACTRKKRDKYKVFVRKPKTKITLKLWKHMRQKY